MNELPLNLDSIPEQSIWHLSREAFQLLVNPRNMVLELSINGWKVQVMRLADGDRLLDYYAIHTGCDGAAVLGIDNVLQVLKDTIGDLTAGATL